MIYIIFSDVSSITQVCLIMNFSFENHATFYNLMVRYGNPILLMIIFGFFAYQNMKKIVVLAQHGADR